MNGPSVAAAVAVILSSAGCAAPPAPPAEDPRQDELFAAAEQSAATATAAFERADRFVRGWLAFEDRTTALFPERTTGDGVWTPKNAAADLWPFMVLTSFVTDHALLEGTMRRTLEDEIRLTSRVGSLPDDFSLVTHDFAHEAVDMSRILFGASEYAKDGLLPISEVMGRGPYFDRLLQLVDGILAHAGFETGRGNLPSDSLEVNGELLQVLSRLHGATRDASYLDMAARIADYYLFDAPLDQMESLPLKDHGSEIVSGLVEAYIALKWADRSTPAQRSALRRVLDRILLVGRNEDGLIYDRVNMLTGEKLESDLADTWGYIYFGIYAFGLLEDEPYYLSEVRRVLGNLSRYHDSELGGDGMDDYADSIESALVLSNREPVEAGLSYVESAILQMFDKQQDSGIVEGWWGDGNFGRTALMYGLFHTRGLRTDAWRDDLRLGAREAGGALYVHIDAASQWSGRVIFDGRRHRSNWGWEVNYPRLNELPEWYAVDPQARYEIRDRGDREGTTVEGTQLLEGIPVELTGDALTREIEVRRLE